MGTEEINLIEFYNLNSENNQIGGKSEKIAKAKKIKYPSDADPLFEKKIEKIFGKYKIRHLKKTNKELCYPAKFELQNPQKFLPEYLSPETNYKNLLVFHKIGSGKSCTGIRIAEKWKHKRKIIFVVPAFLIGSLRNEIRSECTSQAYMTNAERKKIQELNIKSKEYQAIIKHSNKKIDIHYEIYSYNKFIEGLENKTISYHNKILIIDEIQNMISESGKYYSILKKSIDKAPENLRIIIMTATPIFNSILEIPLTLNLLRLKEPLPIGKKFLDKFVDVKQTKGKRTMKMKNLHLFKNMIRGRISYYKGAPAQAFPEERIKIVKCPMETFQYQSYKTVLKQDLNSSKNKKISLEDDLDQLPNDFFIGTRIVSNIAYPNKKTNESGFKSFTSKIIKDKSKLKKYSIKIYKILSKIKSCKGTAFIYSNFKEYGGIKPLLKVLEAYGYKNFKDHHAGKHRFAIWTSDENNELKDEIRTIFNKKDNLDGSKIKIVIGSPSIKEGVSLFRVKQVHVLEPYWNESRMKQIIGRAVRFCSHKDLPKDERYVDIYIYLATHPNIKKTVDQHIYNIAKQKVPITEEFIQALKDTAIDRHLNALINKGNGFNG